MTASLILLGAIISGIGVWALTSVRTSPEPSLKRFVINLPPTTRLASTGMALSPDGMTLVYGAFQDGIYRLYRRSMDQLESFPIPGTEGANVSFFSPDGQWLGFFNSDNKLQKVSLLGGTPVTLYELSSTRRGGSWGQNENIVFSEGSGLLQIASTGGIPQEITVLEQNEDSHRWMDLLPDGKAVLFTHWTGSLDTARIAVQSLESGERKVLVDGTSPRYALSGHIVFAKSGALWAVPFDVERLELTGSPTPVLEGVQISTGGHASFTMAHDGSLAFIPGSVLPENELVWVDREGNATPLTQTQRIFSDPRLSPDGKHLSVTVDDGNQSSDVWIYELDRGTLTPLTFGETGETNAWPIWSLDGKLITFGLYHGQSPGLFTVPADGSGEARQLTTIRNERHVPTSRSSDGVLAYTQGPGYSNDIYLLSPEGKGEGEPFLETEFNEKHPMFSPAGHWIAFTSDRSGQNEVYVKPYPGEGGIIPISSEGGHQPVWAHSGKELFYRKGEKMMVVSIQTESTFQAGTPRVLFEGMYLDGEADMISNYDVTPDGQQFVMVRSAQASEQIQINVVLNWFEELKRLVPTDQ
jgi:serine/threonine-protein kinase